MSILEPFIDTILICTITGLVILSSGVWKDKHENTFDRTDMYILAGNYVESSQEDKQTLYAYINDIEGHGVTDFTGEIQVVNGKAVSKGFTIFNARSFADNVVFSLGDAEDNYTGTLEVVDGSLVKNNIIVRGESLIHSAELMVIRQNIV